MLITRGFKPTTKPLGTIVIRFCHKIKTSYLKLSVGSGIVEFNYSISDSYLFMTTHILSFLYYYKCVTRAHDANNDSVSKYKIYQAS